MPSAAGRPARTRSGSGALRPVSVRASSATEAAIVAAIAAATTCSRFHSPTSRIQSQNRPSHHNSHGTTCLTPRVFPLDNSANRDRQKTRALCGPSSLRRAGELLHRGPVYRPATAGRNRVVALSKLLDSWPALRQLREGDPLGLAKAV